MRPEKALFYKYLAQTSPAPLALEIEKAEGSYLFDVDGKKFIDFISGISVSNVGHRHPKVIKATKNQLDKYMHLMVYGEYIESPQVQFARRICDFLPEYLNSVYFVNSGAEAIEGAMKLAKKHTGRYEIIAFKKAYHGSTQGALSIMGNEKLKQPFRPLLPDIKFFNFNDFDDLNKISNKTAAVVVEVIQGEAGIVLPLPNYLKSLDEVCKKNGALLIVDEIQTGMGRTGKMFGFEHFEIRPDIITLAKALGGGMPLGAFIASSEIMTALSNPPLGHITTFGGHPVCCAAGLAALNVIVDENLIEKVDFKGESIKKLLTFDDYIVHGKGLFLAMDLKNAELNFKVIEKCIQNGLIADWFLFADSMLRISPPLNISDEDIKIACDIIKSAIKSCRDTINDIPTIKISE